MTAKMITQKDLGQYRIALLDDGEKFIRMRTPDPYSGNIEYMDLLEASKLRDFLNSREVSEVFNEFNAGGQDDLHPGTN